MYYIHQRPGTASFRFWHKFYTIEKDNDKGVRRNMIGVGVGHHH